MAVITEARKAALIEQHRDINVDHEWWEYTIEDFMQVMEAFGMDVKVRSRNWSNASTGKSGVSREPMVYFSLSYSQGDGASFDTDVFTLYDVWKRGRETLAQCAAGEGDYNADPEQWTGYLREMYLLWHTIDRLYPVLLPLNSDVVIGILDGTTVSVASGNRSCGIGVDWDYTDADRGDAFDSEDPQHQSLYATLSSFMEDKVIDARLNDVNGALFDALKEEYEHLTSDEQVWEAIEANDLATPDEDDDEAE